MQGVCMAYASTAIIAAIPSYIDHAWRSIDRVVEHLATTTATALDRVLD
jgi:hypothetical protein